MEAKALGENLTDHRWASQFIGYAGVAGVEWVAVTDGNEWRIYNAHASVPIEEKLFRRVSVEADDPGAAGTLSLLSKSQLQDNQIDALWKSDFVDRQVRDALVGLFTPEPDAALVRLIRSRAASLSQSDIRASLRRLRVTFDFPVVAAAAGPRDVPRDSGRAPVHADGVTETVQREVGAGTPWRHVSLAELIGASLVRLPLQIEHRYRGTPLTARIEAADRISFGGSVYESLSLAGGMARKSVVGAPQGREYPQTNGWTFWEYRRADGTLGPLDELRRAPYEGKVVSLAANRRAGA